MKESEPPSSRRDFLQKVAGGASATVVFGTLNHGPIGFAYADDHRYPNQRVEIIEDPTQNPVASPYLIFPVTQGDVGVAASRVGSREFQQREPVGVRADVEKLLLTVVNLGQVASDLVKIDYQFVICVDRTHQVNEGFTREHADEVSGHVNAFDNIFVDYVAPRGSLVVPVDIPKLPTNIANLYFHARVSTIWSRAVPPTAWNFKDDVTVVEFTKRF
ncbi:MULTISPECIES: hypothetical protein [unclassified Caballeronia]|uniref:hypothetical protein n=1 Tax=unclassified Caballeronia TaxID=2646786 RepID=UPI00202902CB|nr:MULTISPECIES: hypothetical protein [unclassified Caballeronia]